MGSQKTEKKSVSILREKLLLPLDSNKYPEKLVLLLILAAAAVLRFWGLTRFSFWIDEVYSFRIIQHTLSFLWGAKNASESNPPLYYTLLKFWQIFGNSEYAIRSLSAFFGVLTTGCVYYIAKNGFGRKTAIFSAILLAISPVHIYYSQEARNYIVLCDAASLMILSVIMFAKYPRLISFPLWKAIIRGKKNPLAAATLTAWALFFAGAVIAFYSHYTSVFLIFLATCAVLILTFTANKKYIKGSFLNLIIVGLLAGSACILWIIKMLTHFDSFTWIQRPTIMTGIKHTLQIFSLGALDDAPRGILGLLLTLLALWGAWCNRKKRATWILLLFMIGFPILIFAVSQFKPTMLRRTMLWNIVPFVILLVQGGLAIPFKKIRIATAIVILVISLYSIISGEYTAKHDWRTITSDMMNKLEDDDVVLLYTANMWLPVDYHIFDYHKSTKKVSLIGCINSSSEFLNETYKEYTNISDRVDMVIDDLGPVLSESKRVWLLINSESTTESRRQNLLGKFENGFAEVEKRTYQSAITVRLFEKK